MAELEALLGDHNLVTNPRCLWNTAIAIHSRWKISLRKYASYRHAVRVSKSRRNSRSALLICRVGSTTASSSRPLTRSSMQVAPMQVALSSWRSTQVATSTIPTTQGAHWSVTCATNLDCFPCPEKLDVVVAVAGWRLEKEERQLLLHKPDDCVCLDC